MPNPKPPKPRPAEGSKKWNPLIIPWLPQRSNGFYFGGFHFLDPLEGLGSPKLLCAFSRDSNSWILDYTPVTSTPPNQARITPEQGPTKP